MRVAQLHPCLNREIDSRDSAEAAHRKSFTLCQARKQRIHGDHRRFSGGTDQVDPTNDAKSEAIALES
jgi:hypothetical protein